MMEPGRRSNKEITSNTGEGLSPSAASSLRVVEPMRVSMATPSNMQYTGEDDAVKVFTGPGDGDYVAGNSEPNPQRWGYTAPSGSRVEVHDGQGEERITLVHHSGAAVSIDPDGSIFLVSTSKRGSGIASPFGDVFINAGGDIAIQGSASVSIDTPGDLNLNVGGTLNIRCNSYNLLTKVEEVTVDGHASRNVTKDQSVVIGGISRETVAGDKREQISGNKIVDIAKAMTTRIDGNEDHHVTGTRKVQVKGDHQLTSKAKTNIFSDSDLSVHTKTVLNTRSGGNTKIESKSRFDVESTAQASIKTASVMTLMGATGWIAGSPESTNLSGKNVVVEGTEGIDIQTLGTGKFWSQTLDMSGDTILLKATTLIAPPPTGLLPPETAEATAISVSTSVGDPTEGVEPTEAETPDVNDVIDSLTSNRKYPEYAGNGVHESAQATNLSRISGDEQDQAEDVYNEYSGQNQGNINASYPGESVDTLPDTPVNRDPNIEAVDPDISTPSQNELSAKISKYFTMGQLVNGSTSSYRPPTSKWEQVAGNGVKLAVNVLDAIKDKFPDIIITSWYRPAKKGSTNHVTGRAVDIVVHSRSLARHAEIARFARDNLPVDQVFLEKNNTGRTHVHLRVSEGKGSSPRVMTCGNATCTSNTPGIDVNFLMRKGVK